MLLDKLAQIQAQRTTVREQFIQKVQTFSKDLLDILNDIDLGKGTEKELAQFGIGHTGGKYRYNAELNTYDACQQWFAVIKPGLETAIPALIESLLVQENQSLAEIDSYLNTIAPVQTPVLPSSKPDSINTSAVIDEDLDLIKGLEKVLPPSMQCVKCDKRYEPAEVFAMMDEGKLPIPKNCNNCQGNLIRA